MAVLDPREEIIIGLIIELGLTPPKICALEAGSDFSGASMKLRHCIRKYSGKSGPLFPSARGRLCARRIEQIVSDATAKLGHRQSARDLRRKYLANNFKPQRCTVRPCIKSFDCDRDRLIIGILAETGCRVSELIDLKKADLRQGALVIGKDKRHVPVSARLYARLSKLKGYLISGDKKLSPRRVQQIVKSYSGDQKLTPMAFRNSFVYNMHKQGKSTQKIGKMLGINIGLHTHGLVDAQ